MSMPMFGNKTASLQVGKLNCNYYLSDASHRSADVLNSVLCVYVLHTLT